jgi:DNA mismatch repair protein MutS
MNYPLLEKSEIRRRSEAIEALLESSVKRTQISESLHDIADLERIAGKISLRNITPRDLIHLKTSSEILPGLLEHIADMKTELLEEISCMDDLAYVAHAIGAMIVDSPPAVIRDGGVIRSGFNAELDELRSLSKEGKQWIAKIEETERSATGIPNLKIGYNKVFGYFIEVSKSYQQKVPSHYIRKQTLVNAERYITEDLKEYELKVINAQERIVELEEELFNLLRTKLLEVIPRIQDTARKLATLDVLTSLAQTAALRSYCRPEVTDSDVISIEEGRHPVVETFDDRETYVANDTFLSNSTHQILLITGPNMAGKSTFMRQTALIVIMAQMGGFVPAKKASIGVVDRIFTRIGAADYLAFGQSTFMVEMNETADIVHNATARSLVLLDEIGRGTSTFDGLSIAWAVTEYLHDKVDGPRTMFATHYHELTDIARIRDRVKNFFIEVREWGDKIVFIRKIVQGVAGRSYGIQVAKLAGIPQPVIDRAKEILSNLEKEELDLTGKPRIARKKNKPKDPSEIMQADLFGYRGDELVSEIQSIDPDNLTPIQALNLISDWKRRLDT